MSKLVLATSCFCAPCKMIKEIIAKKGVEVEFKDMLEDRDFFKEHQIKAVPKLFIDGVEYEGHAVQYFMDL